MQKPLIVFYSHTGFTKKVATMIAEKAGGDILEIHPKNKISQGFIKHFLCGKQVILRETPELEDYAVNFDHYETIYIGTPVWAFNFSPAIRSFVRKHELKNKKIILFCTHQGRPRKSLHNLKSILHHNEILHEKEFNRKLLENDMQKLESEIMTIVGL